MTYQELTEKIGQLGTTKKGLEQLLNYSENYLSSFTKKPIPKHVAITIELLVVLHVNKIDYKAVINQLDLSKNPHKGGKFESKYKTSHMT